MKTKPPSLDESVVAVIIGLWSYEAMALATRRMPTLTAISDDYPWLKAGLITLLTMHLYRKVERIEQLAQEAADVLEGAA